MGGAIASAVMKVPTILLTITANHALVIVRLSTIRSLHRRYSDYDLLFASCERQSLCCSDRATNGFGIEGGNDDYLVVN